VYKAPEGRKGKRKRKKGVSLSSVEHHHRISGKEVFLASALEVLQESERDGGAVG
jgi:hypothetical protein